MPAQPDDPGPAGRRASGRLFLIPTPIGSATDAPTVLPAATLAVIASLEAFIVETPKAARAVLGAVPTARPLQSLDITVLDEHTRPADIPALLAPLRAGRDVGLLSDAGCPGVADPGAALVAAAHAAGIQVVPLGGPSAILLALMASGMQGQRFGFAGYLPAQADARAEALRELERRSARNDETWLWIETPYRNQQVFETALATLAPSTLLLVAAQLATPAESILRHDIRHWRQHPTELARAPTVFAVQAESRPDAGARAATTGPGAKTERSRNETGNRSARAGRAGRSRRQGPRQR